MIENNIQALASQALKELYTAVVAPEDIIIQKTRKEFEGDYTINVFPFLRLTGEKPDATAEKIGNYLRDHAPEVKDFNVIKGFLNIVLDKLFWTAFLSKNYQNSGCH